MGRLKDTFKASITGQQISDKGAWNNNNLGKDFYNFYASADLVASNLGLFMDDKNKGKDDDAYFSLKVAYDELSNLERYIKTQKSLILKELKENNKIR